MSSLFPKSFGSSQRREQLFPTVSDNLLNLMWHDKRETRKSKAQPLFEQPGNPTPATAGDSLSGPVAGEIVPSVPAQASEVTKLMAHWADPGAENNTLPSHQPASNEASVPENHSSFSKLFSKAGAAVHDGANWIENQAGNAVSSIGDKASEAWQSGKAGLRQTEQDFRHAVEQEGVRGALLDPLGALDRQMAQRELSDRFQVVPSQFVGPRLPNQVTETEYAQIARTYSDIRLGRGDLTIDASAYSSGQQRDAYQAGALADVAALMQTRSGRHEIEQLHDNGLRDENGKERCGILGIPASCSIGSPLHHHTTLVPLLERNGMPVLDNGHASPDGKGDARSILGDGSLGAAGSGTDVHVRYNPGVSVGRSFPTLAPMNPWLAEMRSDILLAHEMNHAIKQTQGMVDNRPIRATDNSREREDPAIAHDAHSSDEQGLPLTRVEHQAVGLGLYADTDMTENRYRAERRDIASAQRKGLLEGDSTLHQRDAYAVWTDSPAPAAASSPAPAPAPISAQHFPGHERSRNKHRRHHPHE